MSFLSLLNPISAITGLIGAGQAASASHNAANAEVAGYNQAGTTVNNAVNNANPVLSTAAQTAGSGLTQAAGNVAGNVAGAASIAGQGATNAAGQAGNLASGAYGNASNLVNPYLNAGNTAANQLAQLTAPGADTTALMQQMDPGYQFRLSQGLQGVNQSQAAKGLLNSGATLRGLTDYAQNYASGEYQNTFNRLQSLAGMGQQAGEYLGGMGANQAQFLGGLGLNAAQYAGNTGLQAAQYGGGLQYGAAGQAGQWGVNAANQQASNLVNAGVYQGNTQIGAGNAIAAGDIGAANAWNGGLNSLGASLSMNPFNFGGGGGGYPQGPWAPGAMGAPVNFPQPQYG